MKTPQRKYWTPILNILDRDKEGSVKTRKIKTELLKMMEDQFNQDDFQDIPIGKNHYEPAWWNQARHAAEKMRKEELLAPSTEHSIWTITEKGKQYLISETEIYKQVTADLEARAEEDSEIMEGQKQERWISYFERNPKLRAKAIAIHGTTCKVCGFNFKNFYGEHGQDYIEVHHLVPLATLPEASTVNPETDLTVLCANCHRMIHRKRDATLSVEELRQLINHSKSKSECF